jgi:hypothetical protein
MRIMGTYHNRLGENGCESSLSAVASNQDSSPQEVLEELQAGESIGHLQITPEWLGIKSLSSPMAPMARAALDPATKRIKR